MAKQTSAKKRNRTLSGMDHTQRVVQRLSDSSDSLEMFKRKVYDFRKLVAGDFSKLLIGPAANQDEPQPELRIAEFYDFIVTSYGTGHSNELLKTVKQLLMEISFRLPEIEVEDLPPLLAAVTAGYLKNIFSPAPKGCSANDEMRMTLLDYLIGGIGWVKTCSRISRTILMNCDTLDMSWDRSGRLPTNMRWASCRFREPLFVWMEMFDDADWSQQTGLGDSLDKLVELEFYYDVEGEEGWHYVFRTETLSVNPEPVYKGPNPYFFENAETGDRQPFIPYVPMYFLALPNLRAPIGIVEQMIPNQIAAWEGEESLRKHAKAGVPFYTGKEGTLNPEERAKFMRGEIATYVEYTGDQPPSRQPGIEANATLMNWFQYNKRELQGHSGTNPYAGGAPPQGIGYAREVQEISSRSGLTAGYVSADYANCWVRASRQCLAIGRAYDDTDHTVRYDDVSLTFTAYDPVGPYLFPDCALVVREDTTLFAPRQQKMAEAAADLRIAMEVQQWFPNAPKIAYESYLRAKGEKNLAPWLEAAPSGQAIPGAPQLPMPGMPGQMGPAPIGPGAPAGPNAGAENDFSSENA